MWAFVWQMRLKSDRAVGKGIDAAGAIAVGSEGLLQGEEAR